jgi:hypothetical protein
LFLEHSHPKQKSFQTFDVIGSFVYYLGAASFVAVHISPANSTLSHKLPFWILFACAEIGNSVHHCLLFSNKKEKVTIDEKLLLYRLVEKAHFFFGACSWWSFAGALPC